MGQHLSLPRGFQTELAQWLHDTLFTRHLWRELRFMVYYSSLSSAKPH